MSDTILKMSFMSMSEILFVSVNIEIFLEIHTYIVRVRASRTYSAVFSNFVLRNGVSMELMRFPLENTHSTWVCWLAEMQGWEAARGDRSQSFFFFFFAGECISGVRVVRVKGFGQQQRWTTRFYWSDVMRMSRGG